LESRAPWGQKRQPRGTSVRRIFRASAENNYWCPWATLNPPDDVGSTCGVRAFLLNNHHFD
jgi:hypothetical protein